MKNSLFSCGGHVCLICVFEFPVGLWQLATSITVISITRRPRSIGSVMWIPLGLYTRSFCVAMNFDTFLKCWKREKRDYLSTYPGMMLKWNLILH